ncbi:uncharacterized protein LOC143366976 isoform X2 [Andrena cerasifolii]|uniref:uncharacterized protein LOC143366976 isoform X2 n=1 Tax=Andrena cerasifolii TaxID=2819439 RepID=UPI004037D654
MMTCSNKRGNSLDHITTKRNLCNVEKNVDDNRNRAARICNFFAEPKQERTTVETKKKVFMETYSVKDILPTREVDNSKVWSKRSNASVNTSPRAGPRSGTVKATSKSRRDHFQHDSESASSKNCEKTSYEKMARQKTSKESKILRVLEDIIKTTPMEKKGEKSTRNPVGCYQFQNDANSVHFELQAEPTLDKEDVKINEEEPTRDIDPSEFVKDRPKASEMVRENPQSIEEFAQRPSALLPNDVPPFPITNLNEDVVDVEGSANLEISQPNAHSSSVILANAGCMVDLSSSSDSIANIELTKHCQTSLNSISSSSTSHQEQKNEKCGKCAHWLACSGDCNPDQQQSKNPSDVREERSKVNSHAMSLSSLKEFLCDQGVRVDLVDRAERCLKEKQKTLKYLKKKRVNSIDAPPSAQNLQNESYREDKLKGNIGNHKKDSAECKENREDTDNTSNCPALQPPLERKDAATCTISCSSDASSQTELQWKFTKSLQTNFERDILTPVQQKTTETQTEMTLPEEINNLTNRNRDASVITETLLISDSFTETVQVSYASKSVGTDHVDPIQNGSTKNVQEYVRENYDNSPEMSIYICNEECTERKLSKDDQNSTNSYHHASNKLSNQMYECNDGSLTTIKRNDEVCELCFVKSNAAASFSSPDVSSVCSENCVRNETVTHEESHELSTKVVSNEMLAAFQVAVIRACNVYRAFDLYKRSLRRKLKKLEKQKKRQRTARKNIEMRKRTLKYLSKQSSVSGITTKHWEHFDGNGVAEVLKVLRCTEVGTASSKEPLVVHNESKDEISKSVSMPSISTPCSGNIFEAIEPKISKKSFSNVTLKDVKSVMEFLVRQTENVKLEHTRCVKKISNPTCPRFGSRDMKGGRVQRQGEFSMFSRENLLPLVYGIMCCIVFWCLQVTITCDIIL